MVINATKTTLIELCSSSEDSARGILFQPPKPIHGAQASEACKSLTIKSTIFGSAVRLRGLGRKTTGVLNIDVTQSPAGVVDIDPNRLLVETAVFAQTSSYMSGILTDDNTLLIFGHGTQVQFASPLIPVRFEGEPTELSLPQLLPGERYTAVYFNRASAISLTFAAVTSFGRFAAGGRNSHGQAGRPSSSEALPVAPAFLDLTVANLASKPSLAAQRVVHAGIGRDEAGALLSNGDLVTLGSNDKFQRCGASTTAQHPEIVAHGVTFFHIEFIKFGLTYFIQQPGSKLTHCGGGIELTNFGFQQATTKSQRRDLTKPRPVMYNQSMVLNHHGMPAKLVAAFPLCSTHEISGEPVEQDSNTVCPRAILQSDADQWFVFIVNPSAVPESVRGGTFPLDLSFAPPGSKLDVGAFRLGLLLPNGSVWTAHVPVGGSIQPIWNFDSDLQLQSLLLPGELVTSISCDDQVVALTNLGRVISWGRAEFGILGRRETAVEPAFIELPISSETWSEVKPPSMSIPRRRPTWLASAAAASFLATMQPLTVRATMRMYHPTVHIWAVLSLETSGRLFNAAVVSVFCDAPESYRGIGACTGHHLRLVMGPHRRQRSP